MRHIITFLFLSLAIGQSVFSQQPLLIPQPARLSAGTGVFRLTAAARIGYNQPEARAVADMLATRLAAPTGYKLRTGPTGDIRFRIVPSMAEKSGAEGYRLKVTAKGVDISAAQPAGLFYGMQTLLQLLPAAVESPAKQKARWTIPAVEIEDAPRFAWRGLMLDASRHFFSKEDVKRYIDRMAQYKYNVFHWHLTDDNGWRVEIKSLPKLTSVGACRVQRYGEFGSHAKPKAGEPATDCGFYTQDDIREIVAYAAERHISIVPEVDVPGHCMAAIAAYPELCCTRDTSVRVSPGHGFSEWYGNGEFKMLEDNTLNPSDEQVYVFMDKVIGELAALFPGQYIHVGGDECYRGYWEKDPGCQALMAREGMTSSLELHGYFMRRMEKIVQSKGKKLIGWSEIVDGKLSAPSVSMAWHGMDDAVKAAKAGLPSVMAPHQHTYLDLMQGEITVEPDVTSYASAPLYAAYHYEPVPAGVDPALILGGQGCLWSEKIPTRRHAEYMTWPRGWALAEIYWSPAAGHNWENFLKRMETHMERSDYAQVNYARSAFDPMMKPTLKGDKLWVSISTEMTGLDIFYTLDGTAPDPFTTRYTGPVEVPAGSGVALRAATYRKGKQAGKTVVLPREELLRRAE